MVKGRHVPRTEDASSACRFVGDDLDAWIEAESVSLKPLKSG